MFSFQSHCYYTEAGEVWSLTTPGAIIIFFIVCSFKPYSLPSFFEYLFLQIYLYLFHLQVFLYFTNLLSEEAKVGSPFTPPLTYIFLNVSLHISLPPSPCLVARNIYA